MQERALKRTSWRKERSVKNDPKRDARSQITFVGERNALVHQAYPVPTFMSGGTWHCSYEVLPSAP